jgi:hypothetical protein
MSVTLFCGVVENRVVLKIVQNEINTRGADKCLAL